MSIKKKNWNRYTHTHTHTHTHIHAQTDCCVVSQLFGVAGQARRFKPVTLTRSIEYKFSHIKWINLKWAFIFYVHILVYGVASMLKCDTVVSELMPSEKG